MVNLDSDAQLAKSYARAPHLDTVQALIDTVFAEPLPKTIAELNRRALRNVLDYLDIRTELVSSSSCYGNEHLSGQERVLDICNREGAELYINAIGGRELYDAASFASRGVTLRFLKTGDVHYPQGTGDFIPFLSILDVLMYNTPSFCRTSILMQYDLIEGEAEKSD